jgi:Ankyrin repeats (3 copies)/Ankyrin repeat
MATKKFNKIAFTFLCATLSSACGMQEFTALHYAAREGNLQLVQSLVNSGVVGINTKAGLNKNTPLYRAAGKGHLEIVQWLLENKADVNAACDCNGKTALQWAISCGHMAVAQCLINYGANINAQDKFGQTALMSAQRLDIVQLLIDNNSNINTREVFEKAVEEGYFVLVKNMVESYKINVTKEDIALAKAMWQKTNEAIYKKIGRLLIISCDLSEKVGTSQPGFRVPREIIELIGSFVVEEKSF